jgi:hypothetical protein
MEHEMSASELANRIRLYPHEGVATLHKVRRWTNEGMLLTVANPHQGTGRHRRYPESERYPAIILNALACAGVPIGVLKRVSEQVRYNLARDPCSDPDAFKWWSSRWQAAISGKETVYLFVTTKLVDEAADIYDVMSIIFSKKDLNEKRGRLEIIISGSVVDLTALFAKL